MSSVPEKIAGRQFDGRVALCLIAGGEDFVSAPVGALSVDFAGILGDHHAGPTRRSTSRETWYPRGTEIRNDRQLTVVSSQELAEVAAAMDLPAIDPGWIGANLVLDDIPDLTGLPAGTKLLFAGGVSLSVEAENEPCRIAGRSIASHFPDRQGLDLLFPKAAVHKRGLVASVEKPGTIVNGEPVALRIPAQRPYRHGK